MALSRPPTAQELHHRVAFDRRVQTNDGAGNRRGAFQEQFKVWAAFRSRGGSESVMAERLEGRNIIGVYLRSSAQTRKITSDWQMRDARTGEKYAVRIVDAVTDSRWVYLEARTGSAS